MPTAVVDRARPGRLLLTPLALALVMVETTDLIFAVDSIPAIFAITADPFLVFTSNVFAILGLRILYFALAGMIDKFRYLKVSLAVVLVVVGVKMLTHTWLKELLGEHFNLYLLAVVLVILAAGVVASLLRRSEPPESGPAPGLASVPARPRPPTRERRDRRPPRGAGEGERPLVGRARLAAPAVPGQRLGQGERVRRDGRGERDRLLRRGEPGARGRPGRAASRARAGRRARARGRGRASSRPGLPRAARSSAFTIFSSPSWLVDGRSRACWPRASASAYAQAALPGARLSHHCEASIATADQPVALGRRRARARPVARDAGHAEQALDPRESSACAAARYARWAARTSARSGRFAKRASPSASSRSTSAGEARRGRAPRRPPIWRDGRGLAQRRCARPRASVAAARRERARERRASRRRGDGGVGARAPSSGRRRRAARSATGAGSRARRRRRGARPGQERLDDAAGRARARRGPPRSPRRTRAAAPSA